MNKTYITEVGAIIWVFGQVVSEAATLSPEASWVPWLTFIGGLLLKTAYGTMSLRAVSKIIPMPPKLPKIID